MRDVWRWERGSRGTLTGDKPKNIYDSYDGEKDADTVA